MCVCKWCEEDIVSGPIEHIGGEPMHQDCAVEYGFEMADIIDAEERDASGGCDDCDDWDDHAEQEHLSLDDLYGGYDDWACQFDDDPNPYHGT